MRIFFVIVLMVVINNVFSQILPEEVFFDGYYFDSDIHSPTYKEELVLVKKNNIKTIKTWDCSDSLCSIKQVRCVMKYDKTHRLLSETYFEENKWNPYEKYKYIGDKKIIKKFNADNQYWIKYIMILGDKRLINKIIISGGKCYNIVINYEYNDSLLTKKEIIDNSCSDLEGEGTTLYAYDKYGKICKIENSQTKDIEVFNYNKDNYLVEYTHNKGNPDRENNTIKYYYSNGMLSRKISESFNSGRKDELLTIETTYLYDKHSQLEREIVKDLRSNKVSVRVYKYNDNGLLIHTAWIHPDRISKNIYKEYTYEFY